MTLRDIDARKLTNTQKQKLGEDLAVLFQLWKYKAFFPKNNCRVDIGDLEYLNRRLALQDCIWTQYESTTGMLSA